MSLIGKNHHVQCLMLVHICLALLFHLVGSQNVWTKTPPSLVQARIGSNVTLDWDYDLKGKDIVFAKWGKQKSKTLWEKSFIMLVSKPPANVLQELKGKILWIANATMVIMNVTISDSGWYGCSIEFFDGTNPSSSTYLEVLELSKANQSEHVTQSTVERSNFTLAFDVYANYEPEAFWFKDGLQLNATFSLKRETIGNKSSQMLYRFTLQKQLTHRNDSGLYQGCIQYAEKQVLIRNFTLLVKYPPGNSTSFHTSTGSNILLEGSSPILICTADSYPVPTYELRKSMTSLSNNTNMNYQLLRIGAKDEGIYSCTPKNEVGVGQSKLIDVKIGTTPKISSKQTIHYVTYGGQVEMECVTNAYPVPTISWYKDGVITHETSNSTSNRQAVSRMMLENVTLSNAGNYSCQAENMFGVKKLSLYVHVTRMVEIGVNFKQDVTFSEGSNLSIIYNVELNFPPNVSWFKDGHVITKGFSMSVEIMNMKSNTTTYRFELFKYGLQSEDNGIYHASISYGPIQYVLKSSKITVQSLPTNSLTQKDNELEIWLIPLITIAVAVILIIFAVFCGIFHGRRLRASDPERGSDENSTNNEGSTRSRAKASAGNKLTNGVKNVAFEGDNGTKTETNVNGDDLVQTGNGFNRDSIYRFTVNPMFSNPEENTEINDQLMPFRNMMYLPTNDSHETSEAVLTLENEENMEERYLASPENSDQELREEGSVEDEAVLSMRGLEEVDISIPEMETARTEVDELNTEMNASDAEEAGITEEEVISIDVGEEQMQDEMEEEGEEEDEMTFEEDSVHHVNEDEESLLNSWFLPPISDMKNNEESTPPFEMYISDIFDFRTNTS